MRNLKLVFLVLFLLAVVVGAGISLASSPTPSPTPTPVAEVTPRPDITQHDPATVGPLEILIQNQELGDLRVDNFLKYAIYNAVEVGVPANTIVLLLLLPVIASLIASARHLIGLRGFGIFLPASLSVVFVATGPVVGIGLFLLIVTVSTLVRLILRKLKVKLQYLPRMALILWTVSLAVLGLLFLAPVVREPSLMGVSIFPVLILALLAEDFIRVQLGKSVETAIDITTETLIMALISYVFLTLPQVQELALLNPELVLLGTAAFNILVGKYSGLRFLEYWRFRKLFSS